MISGDSRSVIACRVCGGSELQPFLDLGELPLADALVRPTDDLTTEERFRLDVGFCPHCALVQLLHEVPPQKLFVDNYLYFSSFSPQLLEHSRAHAEALITGRGLGPESFVVELASNDGYLLKNFVERGVPVLGIDPAPDQAAAARRIGVPTLEAFFGVEVAERLVSGGRRADVIIANNVMAHVDEINDFVSGMRIALADNGVITVENPSVWDLIERCAFDTVYHEHFFYHSCLSVDRLMRHNGLYLNDVELFPGLHGGTNRWYIGKHEAPTTRLTERLAAERAAGLDSFDFYAGFGERVDKLRAELHTTIADLRARGLTVAAYGAAAKGATMLNAVGLGTDLVSFVVDRNHHKHGLLMPGTHQPILPPEALTERRPDVVVLLAWNFADEIIGQQQEYLATGGRFLHPVPTPRFVP